MEITKELLEELYLQEKKSVRQLSEVLSKTPHQICRLLKENGIKARPFSTKGTVGWAKGIPKSKETREKLRQKHLGKKLSKEHRDKVIKTLQNGSGEDNPNWKGGRSSTGTGYILILTPEGYRKEHRLVVEDELGRTLTPQEHIHHINGNKQDNRIENLMVVSGSEHSIIHWLTPERRTNMSTKMAEARRKKFWSTRKKS